MEFIKAMEIWKRICKAHKASNDDCRGCDLKKVWDRFPLSCSTFIMEHPLDAELILDCWDKANPVKTFLSDFLEKYPNAPLNGEKTPNGCPSDMGDCKSDVYEECNSCVACWNRPLESEGK